MVGYGGSLTGDRIAFMPDFSAAFVNSICGCCGEMEEVRPGADAGTSWIPWGATGYGAAVSPDGRFLYATNGRSPMGCSASQNLAQLNSYDTSTPTLNQLQYAHTYDEPRGLAVSADGRRVFVAGYGDSSPALPGIQAYDGVTLPQVGPPLALSGQPHDLVMAP